MAKTLSFWHKRHLEEILSDPILSSLWVKDGDKCKTVIIDDEGNVTFGRTRYSFINALFGDTKTISFRDFALEIANALSGQKQNRDERIFMGITEIILERAVKETNHTYIVDALFDTFRYGWDSELKSSFVDINVDPLPKFKKREKREPDYDTLKQYGELRLNSGDVLGSIVVEHKIVK